LVEIGAVVAAIALSETHDTLRGRLITVVMPIDMRLLLGSGVVEL
jgi:hypothetical protein